jgi:glycosyltransferase involved in cell wall biosynthesis
MPRTDVGGGARVLLELSNRLHRRGHRVTVLSHAPRPEWFALEARFVEVPVGSPLAMAVPACDVVLAGYWALVREVAAQQIAPVVHVEQGDFHLFEELSTDLEAQVATSLAAADAHTVVSSTVGQILRDRYAVDAEVVSNAVDTSVFHSGGRDRVAGRRRTVLAVGWDGNAFKRVDLVRGAADRLRTTHPDVDVVWVTPRPPVGGPGAIARVVVAPAQRELADLYRQASAYVCASDYESPPWRRWPAAHRS